MSYEPAYGGKALFDDEHLENGAMRLIIEGPDKPEIIEATESFMSDWDASGYTGSTAPPAMPNPPGKWAPI